MQGFMQVYHSSSWRVSAYGACLLTFSPWHKKKKDMQEQMSEKVPHCLLQKRKRSEPKDYPVRDSIQHSDSMDTICCHPCLRQQTNRRCKFSNCVLFVCVDPISHDFKEGLGLLDLLVHLGSSCHYYICIIPAGHRSACAPTDTP